MRKSLRYIVGLILLMYVGVSTLKSQCNIDSLINSRQYNTAYKCIDKLDSENKNVDLVLKRVDIVLNYYLNSDYHKAFSLIDLRDGEDLVNLRVKNLYGETPLKFKVDSVLLKLMDQYPNDYRLHKALANYYNQVYYDFGDRWGERSEVLLEKSHYYFLKAYENGIYDYYSLYALGYYQTLTQNYFEAQRWYIKSLKMRANIPLTNYNLAVTYLFDGLPQKGIEYSTKAYELYTDSLKKGDASRITGILYSKTGDEVTALQYFKWANELSPNYRPNQMYLLRSYLHLGHDSLTIDLAYQVLIGALHGPELADEFIEMFGQFNKQEQLHIVFDKVLNDFASDAEACGNICFHYGKLLYKEGEKRKSKQMIKRARNHFEKVFDQNHQVFDAINQMLNMKQTKKR